MSSLIVMTPDSASSSFSVLVTGPRLSSQPPRISLTRISVLPRNSDAGKFSKIRNNYYELTVWTEQIPVKHGQTQNILMEVLDEKLHTRVPMRICSCEKESRDDFIYPSINKTYPELQQSFVPESP